MESILNLLGLANRAGKLISGEETVIKKIQKREAILVLIAKDASLQTQKMFKDKCDFYKVTFRMFASKDIIGNAIGKSPRSACAIIDRGFGNKILSMIEQNYGGE